MVHTIQSHYPALYPSAFGLHMLYGNARPAFHLAAKPTKKTAKKSCLVINFSTNDFSLINICM